jgi:hypothetical protein
MYFYVRIIVKFNGLNMTESREIGHYRGNEFNHYSFKTLFFNGK